MGNAVGVADQDRPVAASDDRPWLLLAPLSAAIALVALLGYAYQVRYLYRVSTGTGMGLHTALAFLLLNGGLLACRPDRQPTRTFLASGPAGLLPRRLVPALLLAPLCVGGLLLLGQRDQLWEPAFGAALAAVAMLAVLVVVVMVTARDLERLDRRRGVLQDGLLQAERRFRQLTDAASDAIVSANADGRVCTWNHGAEAIFGWRADEVLGQPLTVLMPERFHAMHLAGLERVRQTGRSKLAGVVELVGRRKDGSEFPVELSVGMWQSSERTGVLSPRP